MSLNQIVNQESSSHSLTDIENMFLGAIVAGMIDSDYILKIKSDYIFTQNGKQLYTIIHKLHLEFGWADFLSIQEELSRLLSTVEAKKYLDSISSQVPPEFNPTKAIEILEESYIKRYSNELLRLASQTIQKAPFAAPETVYAVYEKLESVFQRKVDFSLTEEFSKTLNDIIEGNQNASIIKTGIPKIDNLTGGLSTREITLIGGRPGHGKTTISVSLARSILDANPDLVLVKFELEMDKESIKRKFLSSVSRVSSYKIRINALDANEKERLAVGAETMKKYDGRLFIYDNVYDLITMNKIARSLKAKVIMVDFITLMDDVDEGSIRLSLGRVARIAKRFAKTHGAAYVFFSQLSRQTELREGNRPQASDIAESDILTQLASEIILLWYRFKHTFDEKHRNDLFLIFDKSRYSSIGDVKLHFDPDFVILKG